MIFEQLNTFKAAAADLIGILEHPRRAFLHIQQKWFFQFSDQLYVLKVTLVGNTHRS